MDDTSNGRDDSSELARSDDGDADSPAKPSFLTRLFGRSDTDAEAPEEGSVTSVAEQLRTRNMLVNLRNMRTLKVNDVSVPRADIVGVSADAGLAEVVDVFRRHTWSRLPVFTETLDQPVGLVHLKDLSLRYGFGEPTETFSLQDLLRPLLYVPPSMPIGVLLHKMQIARIHMALVIDEYGGVDGLVTIEDLLEQIVGDISDEHDEDENEHWVTEGPDVYVASARLDLDDFQAASGVDLNLPDTMEDVDTLGGLVFQLGGRVPERGEIVTHEDGHEFEVLDADARRIKRLRVRIRRDPAEVQPAEAAE